MPKQSTGVVVRGQTVMSVLRCLPSLIQDRVLHWPGSSSLMCCALHGSRINPTGAKGEKIKTRHWKNNRYTDTEKLGFGLSDGEAMAS